MCFKSLWRLCTLIWIINVTCLLHLCGLWTPTHFYVHIRFFVHFFALQKFCEAGISKYSLNSYKLPSLSTKYAREETGDRAEKTRCIMNNLVAIDLNHGDSKNRVSMYPLIRVSKS